MEIIIIVAGALILAFIYSEYYRRQQDKLLRLRLDKMWAEIPDEDYSAAKLEAIQKYSYRDKEDSNFIDDITWNDVDLDEIFMLINNTGSAIGEEYLYSLLRHPVLKVEELKKRNQLIEYLRENKEHRKQLQFVFHKAGKFKNISVYDTFNNLLGVTSKNIYRHVFQAVLIPLFVTIIPFSMLIGILGIFVMIAYNIGTYMKYKSDIEAWINVYSFILRTLKLSKSISKYKIGELTPYIDKLEKLSTDFNKFKRGSSIVITENTSGDIVGFFLDYLRMMFHIDIIKFYSMLNVLKTKQDSLFELYETIGFLDSMIAIASFRDLLEVKCIPEFITGKDIEISVKELYHPLIDGAVSNSITTNKSVLLTGSNASGKSTFIKTLAINAILAQTVYTCTCSYYKANMFQIASSMALRDSIFESESYYIVEIKSLKRILDKINDEVPVLCFIDEVLRGTNTLERIAASSRILNSIAGKNAMCIAATHDLELTSILGNFADYHFEEQIIDGQVLFDYKLREGKANSRNAIKLLEMLGYPSEIIVSATEAANEFNSTGDWGIISAS